MMQICRPGLVSTVIPVRNRPGLLADALHSVLAQTYRPLEIIVVDDGSSDDTPAVARALAARHPEIVVIERPRVGIAAARNVAVAAAAGEFVQFLDSDDLLMPRKFERQVAGLRQHPERGISYCLTREYALGTHWSGLPARRTGEVMHQLFPHLLTGRVWAAPTPLYRRDVIEQNGPMLEVTKYEDWEYEGRAAARNVALHYVAEYLADKRDVHHLEGVRKGGVQPDQAHDYAAVHARLLEYARSAGVAAPALERFASKLLAASRVCGALGCEPEARQLAIMAASATHRRSHRAFMTMYISSSDWLGWETVARLGAALEAAPTVAAARRLASRPPSLARTWRHRAGQARATVAGHSPLAWPQLLMHRWSHRQSRRWSG